MSRSELQIEASRANGSISHGPVTEEGKLASSRNAAKHGLLSECILLPGEDPEYFQDLTTEFYEEFHPRGPIEIDLVQTMLVARWRRTRIWFLERQFLANRIAGQPAAASHPAHAAVLAFGELSNEGRTLDLLNRYESRYDRQYFRAHRRLLELQDRRPRNEPGGNAPPAANDQVTPGVSSGNSSCFAKGTQAEPESTENTATDTSPKASTITPNPVARCPFYLTTLPAAIFPGTPSGNPAVFAAGTAATQP